MDAEIAKGRIDQWKKYAVSLHRQLAEMHTKLADEIERARQLQALDEGPGKVT